MPLSLHAAFVPTARQIVASTLGLIDRAEAFCAEKRIEPETLIRTRLIVDMFDLGYQLKSVAVHTAGAIAGVRAGLFEPDRTEHAPTFAAYRALLGDADAVLGAVGEEEMEGWIGRDMVFAFHSFRRDFDADQFLLSFSQPNFQFHAATAYAILRAAGLGIGKVDFLGSPRSRG